MPVDATNPLNDQNYAHNLLNEAVDAERQLWTLFHSKGSLDTDVQELYRKTRSCYENVILNDHEFAELHGIERTLWRLHYKHIDEYRNRIQSANTEHIDPAVALKRFRDFLSEATEFYQELIRKIRGSYGLPKELFIFKGSGFTNCTESIKIQRCQFSCHRCLVCLGDLVRYDELYGNPDMQNCNWSVAATHYLNASILWPDSGNPQNQLAVLATYISDELLAMYHCVRSLTVKEPFPDALNNLFLLFENNRASHLHSLSNEATFDFFKPSERYVVQVEEPTKATEVFWSGETNLWPLIVRMISSFYISSSLEDFPCIFASTISELELLLSLDDAKLKNALESRQHMRKNPAGPLRSLQLVCALIFTIHTLSERSKSQKPQCEEDMKQPILVQLASAASFICMGRIVNRCAVSNPVDHSPVLPAILIFLEWLADVPDTSEVYFPDEKNASAMGYFFGVLVDLLNKFGDEERGIDLMGAIESLDRTALWEDHELRGFTPIFPAHEPLDFSRYDENIKGFDERDKDHVRVHRILFAAMKIIKRSKGNGKWICYDEMKRKFYMAEPTGPGRRESENVEFSFHQEAVELEHLLESDQVTPTCIAAKENGVQVDECASMSGKVDPHEKSIYTEDDEVIVFKPSSTRNDSLPLHVPIAAMPTSRFKYSPLYGGNYVNSPEYDSANIHFSASMPSAPLLPDDSISCSGDSSSHTRCNDLVHSGLVIKNLTQQDSMDRKGMPNFVGAAQVNNYFDSNWTRTQGSSGFGSGYPLYNKYMEFPTGPDSMPWVRQHRDNLNPVQVTDLNQPGNFSSQTLLGRFRDLDVSGLNTYDRLMNSSASNAMSYSEHPPSHHPGYSPLYGADERKERIFTGCEGTIPHGYARELDLRYEQQRLLQYLKEIEWQMQRERHEWRGPFQHELEPMYVPLARHFPERDRIFVTSAHLTTQHKGLRDGKFK